MLSVPTPANSSPRFWWAVCPGALLGALCTYLSSSPQACAVHHLWQSSRCLTLTAPGSSTRETCWDPGAGPVDARVTCYLPESGLGVLFIHRQCLSRAYLWRSGPLCRAAVRSVDCAFLVCDSLTCTTHICCNDSRQLPNVKSGRQNG